MKKKIIFGLAPLLVLALASCVMYNGKGDPKKSKSSENPVSSESNTSTPPIGSMGGSQYSSQGQESLPDSSSGQENLVGEEVKVYLVFGENGKSTRSSALSGKNREVIYRLESVAAATKDSSSILTP